MELSITRFPWYGQIGAFVVVAGLAIFGFWKFYVTEMHTDIDIKQSRLASLRTDVARGVATARRLPDFEQQVTDLEQRLESLRAVLPEDKDVAEILRRVQGLATQSNLSIQRFTPQPQEQQALYAGLPYKVQTEGTYHDLGKFFERIGKFHRIINVSEISIKAKPQPEAGATIVADYVATTFVLQESKAAPKPIMAPPLAK